MDPARAARRAATAARTTLAALAFAALFSEAPEAHGQASTATNYYCQGWQWVGGSSGPCPTGFGWIGERLFNPPIPGTQDYCVYTWSGAMAPTHDDLIDLDGLTLSVTPSTLPLTEDCPVVYPQSDDDATALSESLRSSLRAHVGSADLIEGLHGAPTPAAVRVVIVDTSPDSAPGEIPIGEDPHGYNLANLVEDISCSSSGCFAEVTTALALPRTSTGTTNMTHGGHSGTLSDLAGAIHRALLAWQNDLVPHLILNLSVGWEDFPEIAECNTNAGAMSAPALAVHDVLQHAVQMGALVIAAAGNNTDGQSPPTGLICPAKWQAIPGLTNGDPLVFASHGVDYRLVPLTTARPHGLTPFGGLGLGAVAWRPGDPLPPALTGSSVAAAVLSAVSAVVWAIRPTWNGSHVLEAVYQGGVALTTPTEETTQCPPSLGSTSLTPINCASKSVSLCGTLDHLQEVSCHPTSALQQSQPPLSPFAASALAPYIANTLPGPPVQPSTNVIPARSVSPSRQSTPAIFPQPLYPRCPTCMVVDTGFGAASNPAALQVSSSAPLSNVTLVMTTGGGQTLNFDFNITSTTATYALDLSSVTGGVTSAYLTGMDQGFSWTAPLLVQ